MAILFNGGDFDPHNFEDWVDDSDIKEAFYQFQQPLKPKPILHRCSNGDIMCLNYHNPYGKNIPKISNAHLLNMLKYIKNQSETGITIRYNVFKSNGENAGFKQETISDKQKVLDLFNYEIYLNEAKQRNII